MKIAAFASLVPLACAGAFALAPAAHAAGWINLDDEHHVTGEKLTERGLVGKVVLVGEFDPADEAGEKAMEWLAQNWKGFDRKALQVIGSCPEGCATVSAPFPVYRRLAHALGNDYGVRGSPYFYVFDSHGKIVYAHGSSREATEALVNAIASRGAPVTLYGEVLLRNFKALSKTLVLGKPVGAAVKSLEKAAKAKGKGKVAEKAAEAREILAAIEKARKDVEGEIALRKEVDPEEALRLIRLYQKTWPKEGAAYGDDVTRLTAAAAEAKRAAAETKRKESEAEKGK